MSVADLLDRGVIEIVAADTSAARRELEQATTHLDSAQRLIESDPVMAHSAAYDAARKAVAAHMRARGYRVRGSVGYHARMFEYAVEALSELLEREFLERLDDMRGVRNDAAYRVRTVGRAEVEADIETARLVVTAVAEDL